jgi:hypothetical protein
MKASRLALRLVLLFFGAVFIFITTLAATAFFSECITHNDMSNQLSPGMLEQFCSGSIIPMCGGEGYPIISLGVAIIAIFIITIISIRNRLGAWCLWGFFASIGIWGWLWRTIIMGVENLTQKYLSIHYLSSFYCGRLNQTPQLLTVSLVLGVITGAGIFTKIYRLRKKKTSR